MSFSEWVETEQVPVQQMILPLITHLCFSEGPSTQARFPWIWLSMLDAISWESS